MRLSRLIEIAAENEFDLSPLTCQCQALHTVSEDWITDVTTPPDQADSEELSEDSSLQLSKISIRLSAEVNDTTILSAIQRLKIPKSEKIQTDFRTSFFSTPGTSFSLTKATRARFTANLSIHSPEEMFSLIEDGKIKR